MHSTVMSMPKIKPTIFGCYKPIERYLELLEAELGQRPQPAVVLHALDAFLMHQVASFYPGAAPSVIDLAADATLGVSTVLWMNHPRVEQVLAPRSPWAQEQLTDWRGFFADAMDALDLPRTPPLTNIDVLVTNEGESSRPGRARAVPVILALAAAEETADQLSAYMDHLFAMHKDAVILVMPVGMIGKSAVLEVLLAYCHTGTGNQLTVFREVSPFFASSQLALVRKDGNPHIASVLRRLQQLYDGNFQFLTLARDMTALAMQLKEKEQEAKTLTAQLMEKEQLARDLTMQGEQAHQKLAAITSGTGWFVLRVLRRLRFLLAPRGTWREGVAKAGVRGLRAARRRLLAR